MPNEPSQEITGDLSCPVQSEGDVVLRDISVRLSPLVKMSAMVEDNNRIAETRLQSLRSPEERRSDPRRAPARRRS